jgi:glutathione S-transferase
MLDGSEAAAAHQEVWPIGRFPVLRDEERGEVVPEATIIVEYLATYYPGSSRLIPSDPDLAWRTRLKDRFFDLYMNEQVGKIVTDRLRPAGRADPHGVERARGTLATALGMLDKEMSHSGWAMGEAFTMADCAAAPALFYADMLIPLSPAYPNAARYLERLKQRPSYARALEEAKPYLHMVPKPTG